MLTLVTIRSDSGGLYSLGWQSRLSVSEKSLMYSTGCRLGSLIGETCFKQRQMNLSVVIDTNNHNRLSVYMKSVKVGL